jgi:hypothetical protein
MEDQSPPAPAPASAPAPALTPPIRINRGERDETNYKRDIFDNKSNIEYLEQNFGNADDVSLGIEIINHETNLPYMSREEIKKSPSGYKADIIIKFIQTNRVRYVSIKSLSGQKPSILNHTPRSASAFQTTLRACLDDIDILAREYIEKRSSGTIREDVKFCDLESSKDENIRRSFADMLIYFVFKGTGSKMSPKECDSILIINRDKTLTFIDCDTDEKKHNYVASFIDKCVVSFRNKGMPSTVTDVCIPWIYTNNINGKKCGSLHVRL